MLSVFDIASDFVERAGGEIQSVKLQKLCFYAFGWYAHLTGEKLFNEQFYAMEYGPVVGELLSAHAKKKVVTSDMIADQIDARTTVHEPIEPYVKTVLDAVWDTYGHVDGFKLAQYSHDEDIWAESWQRKPEGSKRGDLYSDGIVKYFLWRAPGADEGKELPPAKITVASQEALEQSEDPDALHQPFVDSLRKLLSA